MKGRSRKFIAVCVAATLAIAVVPAVVVASIITNATGIAVKITTALKSNTQSQFTGTTGPLTGLVTKCNTSSSAFNLTSKGGGLGPITVTPVAFGGCSDNLGGTDTLKSNTTNGPWTVTYVNSTGSNPNTIKIGIPKAGQTLVSSIAPACTVTIFPNANGSVSGTYDNAGNLQLTNQSVGYSAAGTCPTGTGSGTAHFSTVLKSGGTGTPGYVVTPPVFGVH